MSQDYLNLNSVLFPGLVPEPPGQVAQARQHEEGAGAARAQRAPPDLLRGAHPTRGDHEARAAAEGEEAHQTGAEHCITDVTMSKWSSFLRNVHHHSVLLVRLIFNAMNCRWDKERALHDLSGWSAFLCRQSEDCSF